MRSYAAGLQMDVGPIDTLTPNDAPPVAAVRALLKQLLGTELPVERVREGVATFVYRVRAGRDVLYLRVWPLAMRVSRPRSSSSRSSGAAACTCLRFLAGRHSTRSLAVPTF
jgi:hypothetical protein